MIRLSRSLWPLVALLASGLAIKANSPNGSATGTLLRQIQDASLKLGAAAGGREARKLSLFKPFWFKPKVSPLYLLDGTVCRFVNFQPVCTTLTTTGVMRGATSGGGSGGGRGGAGGSGGSGGGGSGGGGAGGGGGSGGASRPGGGGGGGGSSGGSGGGGSGGGGSGGGSSGGGGGNQRPSSAGILPGGSSVQFAGARPAALMDDDPQDLNVDASSNLTDVSKVVRDRQQLASVASGFPVARPVNYLVRRRPSLLQIRRPARPLQVVA